jgi:hypothetical protein
MEAPVRQEAIKDFGSAKVTRRRLLQGAGRLATAALASSLLPSHLRQGLAKAAPSHSFRDVKHIGLVGVGGAFLRNRDARPQLVAVPQYVFASAIPMDGSATFPPRLSSPTEDTNRTLRSTRNRRKAT